MRAQPVNQRLRIHVVQAGGLVLAAVVLLAQPLLGGHDHELMEMAGLGLIVICVAGRMWSILYVGKKKNRELVTSGPYSMTRNPLYLFSTVGAVGVGLAYGSVAVAAGLGLLAYLVFAITAGKEAEHLKTLFGARYDAYAGNTPLFWPRLSQYSDSAEVMFSPATLRRTFLDGLVFLAAFPAIEAIEHLQADGFLPVLVKIF